jgi:hypothetical protein
MCLKLTRQAAGLWTCRFILGMFEGMNTSGAGLVVRAKPLESEVYSLICQINMWWRKEEHGWRTVVIFNTFSSIINGLFS